MLPPLQIAAGALLSLFIGELLFIVNVLVAYTWTPMQQMTSYNDMLPARYDKKGPIGAGVDARHRETQWGWKSTQDSVR